MSYWTAEYHAQQILMNYVCMVLIGVFIVGGIVAIIKFWRMK